MRIGSVFSGVGGLELGLEWAGIGHTVWQVELLPECRAVLAHWWPRAERFEDVRTVGVNCLLPVDLVCGGFPCQDVSSAGAREGIDGARSGLWAEFARIVSELRPPWVVVENVSSGAALWVDRVRSDLAERGYETLPLPVSADALGAPYRRSRIFVVGWRVPYAHRDWEFAESFDEEVAGARATHLVPAGARTTANHDGQRVWLEQGRCVRQASGSPPVRAVDRWAEPMPELDRVVPGTSARVAARARAAGGNCVVPVCAQAVGYVIRILAGDLA